MTGILTSISGLFSKALVLGALLPAAIFLIAALVLLRPFFPTELPFIAPLAGLDTAWQAAAFTLLAGILATLLYNLNNPIIRLYEGYRWRSTLPGRLATQRQRHRIERLQRLRASLQTAHSVFAQTSGGARRDAAVVARLTSVELELFNELPKLPEQVLPTRLGNVIRSFEMYPERRYGMSSIPLWPRLIGKISGDYAAEIDGAKTSFDFMLNMSFLSLSLALLTLGLTLWYPANLPDAGAWLSVLCTIGAGVVLYWLFYTWSIGEARAWGGTVKSAFDLYRWDLLKQLGYSDQPSTPGAERELWSGISQAALYEPSASRAVPVYSRPSTFAEADPAIIPLEVTRAVELPAADAHADAGGPPSLHILLRVRNLDTVRDARCVTVTDAAPAGYVLVWGQATAERKDLRVSGSNPYRFEFEQLGRGAEQIIRYQVAQMKSG